VLIAVPKHNLGPEGARRSFIMQKNITKQELKTLTQTINGLEGAVTYLSTVKQGQYAGPTLGNRPWGPFYLPSQIARGSEFTHKLYVQDLARDLGKLQDLRKSARVINAPTHRGGEYIAKVAGLKG
jgi:hypothetical protein